MALPTVVGVGTVGKGASGVTPGLPSGTQADDILILVIETSVPGTVTPPSGYAHVHDGSQGSPIQTGFDNRLTVLWKRAGSSESAPTVADTGDHQCARIIGVRGCPTTGDPWDVIAAGSDTSRATSFSIPGLTTTVDDCLLILIAAGDVPDANSTTAYSGWTNGDLANLTERMDDHTNAGDGGGIGVATGEKATAGAVSATSVTISSSAVGGLMSIALKPAVTAVVEVCSHRWGNDDGNEAGYTFAAAANTAVDMPEGSDLVLVLRWEIEETAGGTDPNNFGWHPAWELNGDDVWTNVLDSGDTPALMMLEPSSNFTDQEATTDRLSAGSGTFTAGVVVEGTGGTGARTGMGPGGPPANQQIEMVWVLKIRSSFVADGDTIRVRLHNSNTGGVVTLQAGVSDHPTINVVASGPDPVLLAAVLASSTSLTAALTVEKRLAALLASTTSLAGALTVEKPLSASMDSSSTMAAALTDEKRLAAVVASAASLTAVLTDEKLLAAVIASTSALDANLTDEKLLQAVFAAVATMEGDFTSVETVFLEASLDSVADLAADLAVTKNLAAVIASDSDLIADLLRIISLHAQVASTSDLDAELRVTKPLQAVVASNSNLTAFLTVVTNTLGPLRKLLGVGR